MAILKTHPITVFSSLRPTPSCPDATVVVTVVVCSSTFSWLPVVWMDELCVSEDEDESVTNTVV